MSAKSRHRRGILPAKWSREDARKQAGRIGMNIFFLTETKAAATVAKRHSREVSAAARAHVQILSDNFQAYEAPDVSSFSAPLSGRHRLVGGPSSVTFAWSSIPMTRWIACPREYPLSRAQGRMGLYSFLLEMPTW